VPRSEIVPSPGPQPGATAPRALARRGAAPTPVVAYGLLLLTCMVWGSTWLVIKVGLESLPPITSAAVRIVLAGACMALLARWLGAREGGGRPPVVISLAQGVCQFALNYVLVYYAETEIPSGLVAVLWSVYPLLMSIGGHFFTRAEPLAPRQWFGVVLAFAGVVVLFITDIAHVSASALGVGLLLLLAPLSVAFSTTLIKYKASGASSLLLNRDSMLIGGALLVLLALLFERDAEASWTPLAIGSVVYLALAGTVLTFGIVMWLLRHLPAYVVSLTSYFVPVVALLLGALVAGEPLTLTTILGTLLVLGGVAGTLRRPGVSGGLRQTPAPPECSLPK
jgi:drug/metabolite transporter (DMT)-like permease